MSRNKGNNRNKSADNQENTMNEETNIAIAEVETQEELMDTPAVEIQEDPVDTASDISDEVDMGLVEEEKPIVKSELSEFAKRVMSKGSTAKTSDKNKSSKQPIIGGWPKRGFVYGKLYIADKSVAYTPHHQKSLIVDLLELFPGITMQKMIETIEGNGDYQARLNSNQKVCSCVQFHVKQLVDSGFLSTEEPKIKID